MGLRKNPGPIPGRLREPGELALPLDTLTYAQQQTLHLVARGMSNEEIAAILFIQEGTVRKRLGDIYTVFGLDTNFTVRRVQVSRWWWERGVLAAPEAIKNL